MLGKVESSVLPTEGVFGIRTVWGHHFMERCYAIADFEFRDVCADGVDSAGDVVALVYWAGFGNPFCNFPGQRLEEMAKDGGVENIPVFGIASTDYNLCDNLIWTWIWNRNIFDLDRWSCCYKCFLHFDR